MPTIKILLQLNQLKKTIPSNSCLQILSLKKKHLVNNNLAYNIGLLNENTHDSLQL